MDSEKKNRGEVMSVIVNHPVRLTCVCVSLTRSTTASDLTTARGHAVSSCRLFKFVGTVSPWRKVLKEKSVPVNRVRAGFFSDERSEILRERRLNMLRSCSSVFFDYDYNVIVGFYFLRCINRFNGCSVLMCNLY